ncbi:uncharacterized protein LOC121640964 [Melanotaenia boesemani]|uniref:uncharacterized protein LOC121640964 n=1 Tax=Melanotaenia boesemani TaxID=1250792 RepID=UPI001C05A219|nr:uncharacterized protein LOC121640964 [Melanotaenia boesemani]
MYRFKSDCWIWSPGPHLCHLPQHSGSIASGVLNNQEEQEEENEAEDFSVVCHHTTGCDDMVSQVADAQWSTYEPPVHLQIPTTSGLTECDPGAHSSQHPVTVMEADQGEISQHFIGSYCWEDPRIETHRCVYRQGDQEDLEPCWTQSPLIYYEAMRNVVVGVEVVEEVAVEDTLEIITEEIYANGQMDLEVLEDEQLYPT